MHKLKNKSWQLFIVAPNFINMFMAIEQEYKPTTRQKFCSENHFSVHPQWLQWMMLKLQRYYLQIECVPGKNLHIVDNLSRAPEGKTDSVDEFEVFTLENKPISEERLQQFRQATKEDPAL